MGAADPALAWLKAENAALGEVTPLSLLDTDIGADRACSTPWVASRMACLPDAHGVSHHHRPLRRLSIFPRRRAAVRRALESQGPRRHLHRRVAVDRASLEEGTSAVLAVPSAVVPAERNHLLNRRHPDFARIVIGEPKALDVDVRSLTSLLAATGLKTTMESRPAGNPAV